MINASKEWNPDSAGKGMLNYLTYKRHDNNIILYGKPEDIVTSGEGLENIEGCKAIIYNLYCLGYQWFRHYPGTRQIFEWGGSYEHGILGRKHILGMYLRRRY